MSDSKSRDAILGRIDQALKSPAPRPHWLHDAETAKLESPLFPLPAAIYEAQRDRFRDEFIAVQGEWHEVDSVQAAMEWFAIWFSSNAWKSILAVEHPLVRLLLESSSATTLQTTWCDANSTSRHGWDAIDLGITPCESLIAESGTIVVSSGLAGRAPSVLPPVHLAVATSDQFVPDIDSALAQLRARYGGSMPSSVSLITGPSRTGDIEKILVLGAHGPKRLALLVLPAASMDVRSGD